MVKRPRVRSRGVDGDLVPASARARRQLASRVSLLPENFQPFVDDFRDYVAAEAQAYAKSRPRPKSVAEFKVFVEGFVKQIAVPFDMVQRIVVAAAYRWPLAQPEVVTKSATGISSFATASYGQTIAYGSALSATAGALIVGVVGEIVELYAVASARTSAYRWAGVYPGERVIASDLQQIMGSKQLLAAGTARHIGDEYLTALFDLLEHAVVENIAVPLVGPVRGGYRSFRNVGLAFETPLTRLADGGTGSPPTDAPSSVPAFTPPRRAR